MVKVNFSAILPRLCDDDGDFETWAPASHIQVYRILFCMCVLNTTCTETESVIGLQCRMRNPNPRVNG